MVKKKRNKKGNLFDIGGPIQGLGINPVNMNVPTQIMNVSPSLSTPQFNPFEGAKRGLSDILSGAGSGLLTSAAIAADGAIGSAIGGGLSTGVGDLMSQVPGLGIAGGIINRLFGSKINDAAVTNFKNQNQQLASTILDSSSNSSLLSGYANTELLGEINKSDVGKDGVFSNKASRLTRNLNVERELATDRFFAGLGNSVNNARATELFGVNKADYGGPLTMRYTGTMSPFGNTFAEGGEIYIKKANRGKFTKYCGGKVTSECIAKGKRSSDPAVRKRATFAANARKWKHAFGGDLLTHGAEWDTGITIIGNGGTHEENPMEGVQIGMDAEGTPNLVEQGEVIFNDYVFSNRLKVPKTVRNKYKLRENKGITFADAAKKIAKESEERPNDPISQRGLDVMLGELASIQEDARFKNQMKDPEFRQQAMNQLAMQEQQYAQGGLLGRKYAGPGEIPNVLGTPDQTGPYAFYGNNGRNKVTNTRIAQGWSNFTDNNGNMLYDPEKRTYSPDYLDFRFQSWLRSNYDKLSKDWWNNTNAPDYFKAGNKSAPTFDQMVGTIFNPGLMYDKKYGEAHDFGRYAYNQYRESLKPTPLTLSGEPIKGEIKGLELPKSQIPVLGRDSDEPKRYPTWMRYAPIVAAGAGVFTDALGWTNNPDYSNADAILDAIANGGNYMPVSAAPLGDYLAYNPFDRNYYINKLNAESGATRRAIVNQSAGNRATALAGLLAADYNAQSKLGDLARQAEEYNLGQRERVATFNRGTNQFNSEMGLKAAMANQSAFANLRDYRLRGTMAAAEMREKARMLADANRSANLTNFVQGLGDVGSENVGWNQLQWAIDHGVFGPMQDTPSKGYEKSRKKKNGGKLLTKKI